RGETPAPQRMWSFREGLRVLIDALTEQLGVPVTAGVRVTRVERADHRWLVRGEGNDTWPADAVVLASPADQQAAAVADLDPGLAADMAAVPYNRVTVVALGYRRSDVTGPQDGFGYIAPQNTRRDVLGVQWCSSVYPDRAPPGFVLWRALCGGVNRADVADWPDDVLVAACDRELRHTTGVRGDPVFVRIVRWPRAIPQYEVGHLARVARIEAAVAGHPGLFVAGNSYHGVAMNDVTEHAERTAARIAAWLGG
ncbi:MAG: protoporphyrinogen oxidase, partial [Fimbriiglobus sp.]